MWLLEYLLEQGTALKVKRGHMVYSILGDGCSREGRRCLLKPAHQISASKDVSPSITVESALPIVQRMHGVQGGGVHQSLDRSKSLVNIDEFQAHLALPSHS